MQFLGDKSRVQSFVKTIIPLILECWVECSPEVKRINSGELISCWIYSFLFIKKKIFFCYYSPSCIAEVQNIVSWFYSCFSWVLRINWLISNVHTVGGVIKSPLPDPSPKIWPNGLILIPPPPVNSLTFQKYLSNLSWAWMLIETIISLSNSCFTKCVLREESFTLFNFLYF